MGLGEAAALTPAGRQRLRGIVAIAYAAQEDVFTVRFDSQQTGVEDIIAAVYPAGRQSGQDYLPQMVS